MPLSSRHYLDHLLSLAVPVPGLTLWSKHAAHLPPPWSSVTLEIHDSVPDTALAMSTALASQPDIIFGPYGSHPMLMAMRVTDRVVWNHGGATSQLSRPTFPA